MTYYLFTVLKADPFKKGSNFQAKSHAHFLQHGVHAPKVTHNDCDTAPIPLLREVQCPFFFFFCFQVGNSCLPHTGFLCNNVQIFHGLGETFPFPLFGDCYFLLVFLYGLCPDQGSSGFYIGDTQQSCKYSWRYALPFYLPCAFKVMSCISCSQNDLLFERAL